MLTGLLMVAGCGSTSDNTITVEQAEQQVEDHLRHAIAVLPDRARPAVGLVHTTDCDDPTDNGPKGRKVASADYQIFDLSPAEYPKYVADLEQWWRDNGFRVLDDERPTYQSISVENNDDGFRIRVQDNDQGRAVHHRLLTMCVAEGNTGTGMSPHRIIGLVPLVALLLTSCGTESDVQPTITVRQAGQQAEDYFREALALLPPQARPEPGVIDTYDCDDPTDNGPEGRKIASVDYDISACRRPSTPNTSRESRSGGKTTTSACWTTNGPSANPSGWRTPRTASACASPRARTAS
jgi:hypothetical protein